MAFCRGLLLVYVIPGLIAACGDDSAPGRFDGPPDGPPADARMDAIPATDALIVDGVADAAADASVDASGVCAGVTDGDACPGSTDSNGAERCLDGVCVGTYVAPAPAGNNANPGTRLAPKATIVAGLAVATALPGQDTVYVGKNPSVNAIFFDVLVWPSGAHLSGGWLRAADGSWTRDIAANETRLAPIMGTPIRISDAAATPGNLTISGMRILAAIDGTAGVWITAGAPLLDRVTVEGPDGASTSRGVFVTSAATIQASTLRGGTATLNSTALYCVGCAGLRVTGSSMMGDHAAQSIGVYLNGDTSGVRIESSTIVGGPAAPTDDKVGLQFDGCPGITPGMEPVVTGTTIVGVNGSADAASGLVVVGCPLRVESTTRVAAVVVPGAGVTQLRSVEGVRCQGVTSRCDFVDVDEIAGVVPAVGVAEPTVLEVVSGITFGGSGSIAGNGTRVRAGRAASATAVTIAATAAGGTARAVTISGAHIDAGGCATASSVTSGVRVSGPVRLENDVIEGGECTGISLGLVLVGLGAGEVVEVVNNHITGEGSTVGSSVGVQLQGPGGRFVNNTILAGVSPSRRAFIEVSTADDPEQLRNNDLFGGSTLYLDEGTVPITTIAGVNALANASANISADPLVDSTFHLGATSPNRAAASASAGGVTAPTMDFDGQARPQPAATNPDIGPDEAP
jgi:hypothetical protein